MLVGQGSAASTVAKWAGLARGLHLTFWGVLIIVGVTLALSVRAASDQGAQRANLNRCLIAGSRRSGMKVCLWVAAAAAAEYNVVVRTSDTGMGKTCELSPSFNRRQDCGFCTALSALQAAFPSS